MYIPTNARIISVKELVLHRKRKRFFESLEKWSQEIKARQHQDMMRRLRQLSRK